MPGEWTEEGQDGGGDRSGGVDTVSTQTPDQIVADLTRSWLTSDHVDQIMAESRLRAQLTDCHSSTSSPAELRDCISRANSSGKYDYIVSSGADVDAMGPVPDGALPSLRDAEVKLPTAVASNGTSDDPRA
jgi:hypothetical protein